MIVYFSDRQMQVMGLASTNLPDGFVIMEDLKTEEIETGVATFSCRIGFNDENRLELESMTNAGNFILRSHNEENEFYTIIDTEIDTKNKTINIYAEDAGLDLLNEIAGEFEATEAHDVAWYVNKYIAGSGFEIGINEVSTESSRKLKWEGEETVTSRLASIATQFGGFEISYSFDIDGLTITKKYVNIHKERGKDVGITLRLNQDIDKIITTKSVANLATAFLCEGGVPDKDDKPITFSNTKYTWKDEDNDFYIEGDLLKSRKAIQKWRRTALKLNQGDGVIIRPYSYNTTEPATLRAHAVTELKKVCDMEVNYEVDINVLPANAKIGDRINIVDNGGELYLSTRILVLETSVVDQKHSAILGEHLIKTSGISQKVADLAEQFAKTSVSAVQALNVAKAANDIAEAAKTQAETAATGSESALNAAEEAKTASQNANTSASEANAKAEAAQEAVSGVEATVSEMEKVVSEAEQLAESAKESADIATAQLAEAKTAANNAVTNANEAKTAAEEAKAAATTAINTASTASTQAEEAKANAQAASDVAAASKLDSEQAKQDVAEFAENLETFEATMSATYARKTELTETNAALDAKITANANQLQITHEKVLVIDETANNAKELAEAAQTAADSAQDTADQATADAEAAQAAANEAKSAADAAQTEADNAKAAADAAQGVADKAEEDLATAKANLVSITNRVDATEQEIADAQAAVDTAQQAANKANEDAAAAAQAAANAQTTANTAVTNAANAQSAANDAASKANAAQATANEAKGSASAAQQTADEAKTKAATAQATANPAVTNAETAQAKADQAATDAATAQAAANAADAKAAAAQTDLNTAKQNLANVTSRVDATEEEIAAAEKAVESAQKAADDADAAAKAAQSTADTAKTNAATAQAIADQAKTAANNAKKAADEAKEAADKAQDDADALEIRVTSAETEIAKSNAEIALRAKKTELDAMIIGGRNLLVGSATGNGWTKSAFNEDAHEFTQNNNTTHENFIYCHNLFTLEAGKEYTISFKAKHNGYVDSFDVFVLPLTWQTTGIAYQSGKQAAPPTEYKEYKFTFTPSAAATNLTNCELRIDNNGTTQNGTTATLYIKEVKLEKGVKATDWEPAPEDVDSKFLNYYNKTEMDAELSVMADSIAASVSRIEGVEARASTLEQTASSITSRVTAVENAEIGGRNLFSGYGEEEIQLANYQNVGSFSQFYNCLTFNPCETVGEKYTISFWAKSPNGSTQLRIYNSNGNPRHFNFSATLTESLGNAWTHFKLTITNHDLGSSYSDSVCNRIEIYAPNKMGVLVKKIKVEKGTKATDWTPAPEDVDGNINNVANTAGDAKSTADALSGWSVEAQSQIQQLVDRISMLVVGNGATLWEQTDTGWTFNFADALNTMNAAANNTENISNLTENLNAANQSIDDLQKELMKNAEYIKFTTTETGKFGANLLSNANGKFESSSDSNYGHPDLIASACSNLKLKHGQVYTLTFDWAVNWGGKTPVTNVEVRVGYAEENGDFEGVSASMTIPDLSTKTSGTICFQFTHNAGPYQGSLASPAMIQAIYCSSKDALDGSTWAISNVKLTEGQRNFEPCIELGVKQTDSSTGEVSDGKYKVLITNTRIIFKEGSATPTYISNETLVSEKVEVTQELHHTNAEVNGSFVWQMRKSGNLGLSWKGV